jgi:CubicO group peptidase (beta-lactamase class C family)
MKQIAAAIMLTIVALPAFAQRTSNVEPCGAPAALDDGWQTDKPENVGLDGARLCGIAARMTATNANVHAVVVVRKGKLVYEHYAAGYDDPWGEPEGRYDFSAVSKHDVRSVSKSVTSLLIGIAIDRKLIASVDEPVVKFFPEHAAVKSAGWDGITIRNLLTMSSGLAWEENLAWTDPKNDEPHLGSEADPIRYVLAKPIAAPHDLELQWRRNGFARQHHRAGFRQAV